MTRHEMDKNSISFPWQCGLTWLCVCLFNTICSLIPFTGGCAHLGEPWSHSHCCTHKSLRWVVCAIIFDEFFQFKLTALWSGIFGSCTQSCDCNVKSVSENLWGIVVNTYLVGQASWRGHVHLSVIGGEEANFCLWGALFMLILFLCLLSIVTGKQVPSWHRNAWWLAARLLKIKGAALVLYQLLVACNCLCCYCIIALYVWFEAYEWIYLNPVVLSKNVFSINFHTNWALFAGKTMFFSTYRWCPLTQVKAQKVGSFFIYLLLGQPVSAIKEAFPSSMSLCLRDPLAIF